MTHVPLDNSIDLFLKMYFLDKKDMGLYYCYIWVYICICIHIHPPLFLRCSVLLMEMRSQGVRFSPQPWTEHAAVNMRKNSKWPKWMVTFTNNKSSQRAQSGPMSVYGDSPVDLCIDPISDIYSSTPLGSQRQNGSVDTLESIADFSKLT